MLKSVTEEYYNRTVSILESKFFYCLTFDSYSYCIEDYLVAYCENDCFFVSIILINKYTKEKLTKSIENLIEDYGVIK